MSETKQFKTESKRLLNLMINSIYTNKEIFLRELISNASDAIDKYHYLSLTDEKLEKRNDYHILLEINKENRTLKIIDNGIGMTYDELKSFVETSHNYNLKVALAGSVNASDIPLLEDINCDIMGVRGCVCTGGDRNNGTIDSLLVRQLKDNI